MKLSFDISGNGIEISVGEAPRERLVADVSVDQKRPKDSYVYAHFDLSGVPFYVGKGKGRRAWDREDRHLLWHRYVDKHLQGQFSVRILADGLSSDDAEELENDWIAQESETLVNWVNFGRKTDQGALERFHALRNANRVLVDQARALERDDCAQAAGLYLRAVNAIAGYALMQTEGGLVGQLIEEQLNDGGRRGEVAVLDRLTLCLIKLGRADDAVAAAGEYFEKFPGDATSRTGECIAKRIAKASRITLPGRRR